MYLTSSLGFTRENLIAQRSGRREEGCLCYRAAEDKVFKFWEKSLLQPEVTREERKRRLVPNEATQFTDPEMVTATFHVQSFLGHMPGTRGAGSATVTTF